MPDWFLGAVASLVVAGIVGWITSTLKSQRTLTSVTTILQEREKSEHRLTTLFREDLQKLTDRTNEIEREASSVKEVAMNLDGRVAEFTATMVTKQALEDRTSVLGAQMETVRAGLQGDIRVVTGKLEMVLVALVKLEEQIRRNGKGNS